MGNNHISMYINSSGDILTEEDVTFTRRRPYSLVDDVEYISIKFKRDVKKITSRDITEDKTLEILEIMGIDVEFEGDDKDD